VARLRYVKGPSLGTPGRAPSHLRHSVRSIRALYETEPEIAAALLPRPLRPATSPEIFVQIASVTLHGADERTTEIGAATVGVAASHEGECGYYVLAMPMEGEFVVIGGREKYGEPKKLATTRFALESGHVSAAVTRHGITFLELEGTVGEDAGPRQLTERFYCYKALPACRPETSDNGGFDGDVLLTRLTWEREYTSVRRIDGGRVILRESPFDPLIDVPVKRLVSMELAEGASRTNGDVLRVVPGEWLAPFLGQRYDEPHVGIEVPLASERSGADG
jgi:acetoacetate decarboxylase